MNESRARGRLGDLGPQYLVHDRPGQRPVHLVVMPLPAVIPDCDGAVTSAVAGDSTIWTLTVVPARASLAVIARLLAVLILDREVQVLPPAFMPPGPGRAYLFAGSTLRHTRSSVFAPWINAEVARLSTVLLSEHADFLNGVRATLHGKPPASFTVLPSDFVYQDAGGPSRLAPPPPRPPVNTSQSDAGTKRLMRWQVRQLDYQRNRYMRSLSREELAQRLGDLVGNAHVLNENGLVSLDKDYPYLHYWMDQLTDLQVEMALRYGPYPAGFDGIMHGARLPSSLSPDNLQRVGLLSAPSGHSRPYLVKYGKLEFLKLALHEGVLRVSPASYYGDPSLNPATRDDELRTELLVDVFEMAARGAAHGGQYPDFTRPAGKMRLALAINTNYYVYCTSGELSSRLLLDFEADACLVIKQPSAFVDRLSAAVAKQLPGWRSVVKPVTYYDPLQVNAAEVQVLTCKHFRFAYQRENRVAWIPPEPQRELSPISVRLGSLEDICDLVVPQPWIDRE